MEGSGCMSFALCNVVEIGRMTKLTEWINLVVRHCGVSDIQESSKHISDKMLLSNVHRGLPIYSRPHATPVAVVWLIKIPSMQPRMEILSLSLRVVFPRYCFDNQVRPIPHPSANRAALL